MLNTRYIADLIEKGEIGQIKEAMDKSLSPGSQSFERRPVPPDQGRPGHAGRSLANADSATNLLWLLNNGPDSQVQQQLDDKASEPKGGASFTEFTLNS